MKRSRSSYPGCEIIPSSKPRPLSYSGAQRPDGEIQFHSREPMPPHGRFTKGKRSGDSGARKNPGARSEIHGGGSFFFSFPCFLRALSCPEAMNAVIYTASSSGGKHRVEDQGLAYACMYCTGVMSMRGRGFGRIEAR